ncbi:hypothetical protein VC116059_003152A, partial [Vibrio cholerae O1 str. 116059]
MANDFIGLLLIWFKCKVLKLKHNKRLKRDCQRVAFPVPLTAVVTVVVFEFGVMRCQPLRRALCLSEKFMVNWPCILKLDGDD